jgi:L-fuconolactonase
VIVDAHVHAWSPRSAHYPWQPLGNLAPEVAWTIEEQVAIMDRLGIDAGILVQMSWYGYDNAYILDCAKRHPGRFGLVGMVDPASEQLEAEMEQLIDAGVKGFRLMPRLRNDIPWFSERLWRKANEVGTILTLLVGPEQVIDAEPFIARYPNVKVVIDHLARPDQELDPERPLFQKLLSMARYPNLYIKGSAYPEITRQPYPYADVLDLMRRSLDVYGAERVMWGSDYAMARDLCSLEAALELADRALQGASSADRALVMGGTAARLWNLS